MALDWSNERYVRLYRPSVDHRALCWQARGIWPLLMQEADGAGVLGARKGVAGIAKAIDFPVEVVEAGIADLLDDGCLVAIQGGYCIRNYVEAQTATMTDSSRKARQREVDRAVAALASAAAPLDSQAGPQIGHDTSREVTDGHGASRSVTPSRAEPSREPDPSSRARGGAGGAGGATPADGDMRVLLDHAISRLNQARAAVDPAAPPLPPIQGQPGTDLLDHLRPLPVERRRATLDHAIDVMVATLRAEGKPVGEYRLAMLAGDRAWHRWCAGTVAGAAKGSRPSARGDPSGDTAPPATHGTGTIDPKSIRPRKP